MLGNKIILSQDNKNKMKQEYKQLITSANMLMEFVNADRLVDSDAHNLVKYIRTYTENFVKFVEKGDDK